MFKRHNPGCPCCSAACEDLCFVATGCGEPLPGVAVRVFETGVPGTTLASGTTDANGEWCVDMSAHSGKSLSYDTTPDDLTDYAGNTGVLIGNWCGRTVTIDHAPAVIPGDPGEAGGTINVLFTRCDGTTPWASATVEIKVSFDVEATGTTGSDGRVTLTVPADGSSAYYVRAYRPTDSSPLNSATFTLDAGECADVHMRITHNDLLPCNPDLEAVVTVRDCSGATEDVPKRCCVTCQPDTLSTRMMLSDPEAPEIVTTVSFPRVLPGALVDCTRHMIETEMVGNLWHEGLSWAADVWHVAPLRGLPGYMVQTEPCGLSVVPAYAIRYRMYCGPIDGVPGIYLAVVERFYCEELDPYGNPLRYGQLCISQTPCLSTPASTYLDSDGTPQVGELMPADLNWIPASSITCDPFAATFDVPAITLTEYKLFNGCWGLSGGTKAIPARTITVTEP